MKIAFIFSAALVFSMAASAQDRSITFTEGKWDEIVAKATRENKPIFVDCFTTWCGPCKWLAKNVFTKNEVADFFNASFINVEIDMEKGEGVDLAKKWNVRAYPSLIFLDAKGELVHRSCGVDYRDDFYKDFIQLGKNAMDPANQFVTIQKQVESGKADVKTQARYVIMLAAACQGYADEMQKYFATQKDEDLTKPYNWRIIYGVQNDYASREIQYMLKHRADFEKLYTADSVLNKLEDVYSSALMTSAADSVAYSKMKTEVRGSGITDPEKLILRVDMYRFKRAGDWLSYGKSAVTYTDKYSKDNANELNSTAWTFYEHVDNVELLKNAER
ncbi:MAG TPA: thioredoxin family protein, partial [Bacteroidia bacterium]